MSHIRMLVVATTFLFSTSVLAAGAEDLAADAALHEIVSSSVPHPVAYWSFDQWDGAEPTGDAKLENVGPTLPEFPDFGEVNAALMLKQSAYAVIPDEGPASRFDFDQGDEITIEAWVSLDSMAENAYIIGKGRTGDGDNQNWALRLRSRSGAACVNFLFRSRDVPAEGDNAARPGDWHRWTSKKGFAPGSGWHHVAVTYTFGEPDSIRGYLDGEEVSGAWDMGGATADPPVVDDDAIWIGAAMKGAKSNALDGAIDELAVYRGVLPPEILKSRFRYVPQPPVRPQVPDDKVLVQLYGPISGIASVPQRVGTLLTEWEQVPWAFVRLPNRYDEWGIRDDWGKTLLVRAWGTVELPEGECQLLVRSRGYSRLWIDGQELATTPAQANRSGAHHVVDPLPEVPVEGMRPAAMADRESLVDFRSDGGRHELLWEIIVGGPSFRAEFGETSLSIARGGEMFHVIDAQLLRPLTDMGWTSLAAELQHDLDEQDIATRRAANRRLEPYWHERHEYAIANLKKSRGDMLSIDDVIARKGQRLDHSQAERARDLTDSQMQSESARYFSEHIETIFASQCYRCHGEKKKSGMNLKEHDRLLTGGDSGTAAIVPGEPDASYLVELVSAPEDAGRMPPKGNGLSASEIEKLREWIRLGGDLPQDDVEPVAATEKVDDLTFLRRLYLDTIGMAPTYGEVTEFLAADERRRRQVWIDRLLDDPRTADNWVGYWQDVLAENPNLLKPTLNNTGPFRWWIYESMRDNKPLDRFATELMLMRGSAWNGGTAGFGIATENDVPMAAKAYVIGTAFLGVDMKCARCHDAPYHDWKQSELFQMAAMLDRKSVQVPSSSSVPTGFFAARARKPLIEVTLQPGATLDPHWPFARFGGELPETLMRNNGDTREQLALRITTSRRFAEVMANRIWKRYTGLGLVEPVDDWEGNPPSDPQLLATLADMLIDANYDLKEFSRSIFGSDVYQRAVVDLPTQRVGHAMSSLNPFRRRMSAEQVLDTLVHAVGERFDTEPLTLDNEGTLPAETFLHFGTPRRAWEFTTLANERDRPSLALPKAQAYVDVLAAFGWRSSRPEPTSQREDDPNLIQPAIVANGTLGFYLSRLTDDHAITKLALQSNSVEQFVESLFLQIVTRMPTEEEFDQFTRLLRPGFERRVVPDAERPPSRTPPRFRYVSWSNHLNTEANEIKVQMQEYVRKGPPATTALQDDWRQRAEDATWSLLNSPEMVMVP